MVERHGITFDTTVDIVDDYGADPNGGDPINDEVESAMSAGTLIEFPAGTYQLDPSELTVPGDRIGFLGTGDATWKLEADYHGGIVHCEQDDFLFEAIDLDMSATTETSGHLLAHSPTHFHIEDVEYIGRGYQSGYAVHPGIMQSDSGVGTVKNVKVPHGGRPDNYFNDSLSGGGRIGVFTPHNHTGIVKIIDCEFSEFGNNGIYASRTYGDVRVEDSYFLNNGITGIRISGDGSWAKRCTVEVDTSKYNGPGPSDDWSTWGILVENQHSGSTTDEYPVQPAGCLIEDCEILLNEIDSYGSVGAAIKLGSCGRSLTIRNTHTHVDISAGMGRNTHAVLRANPYGDWYDYRSDMPNPPEPHSITMEKVTATGSASGDGDAAVRIVNSSDSSVSDSCIEQTGSNRVGIRVFGSSNSSIADTNVNVTDEALDLSSASDDVTTSGITYDESCSAPENIGYGSSGGSGGGTVTLDRLILIEGSGSNADYEFTVSVAVEKNSEEASVNEGDTINGKTVSGVVGSGDDAYDFAESIRSFSLSGDATVYVDGNEVDPSILGRVYTNEPVARPHGGGLLVSGGGTGYK